MAKGDVYTDRSGDMLVHFSDSGVAHDTSREPSQKTGWREKADGSREEVAYLAGGWVRVRRSPGGSDAKPFPGHLQVWYEEEELRNPGWRDF